jgi:hypothetical protein
MKTSRLIQYRESEKFLQAKVPACENIGFFRKSSGYETVEKFSLAGAALSSYTMYCTWLVAASDPLAGLFVVTAGKSDEYASEPGFGA